MKIGAFTYVRNGNTFGYPFIESIKSILPLVDEYIVVIGDSTDDTRAAVEAIGDSKIKIIDTIWDDTLRVGGKIFAQQTNIGIDNLSKDNDWLFHLQADEVIHEKDIDIIRQNLLDAIEDKNIEGFLLKFLNFFGDYNYYCPSRRYHQKEIRIIRNNPAIRSYKDSMGFRKFTSLHNATEKGTKLFVKQIDATVYHYSYVKPPKKQNAKHIEFAKKYNTSDDFIEIYKAKYGEEYTYMDYDYLNKFFGTHPAVMDAVIKAKDWKFNYDPNINNMSFKEKFMKLVEDITGKQFFIYKNYIES